jgi:hypothetical protein
MSLNATMVVVSEYAVGEPVAGNESESRVMQRVK